MDGISSFISPVLTIFGWAIAYQLAKMNSTRTESKSIIDACNAIIDNISEKGASFYLDEPCDSFEKRSFEHLANIKISLLTKKLEQLEKRGIKISDEMISDFHVSLTREILDQGTPNHRPDKCVHSIITSSTNISTMLMMIFHKKYPPFEGLSSIKKLFV
ncbi:hypothetical protein RM392_001120 [Enterobacter cloacae]|nr:hypothetical protein [Enterobacter cloacae]HAS1959106.1 hypothetical protein [Enterobacter cloacae]